MLTNINKNNEILQVYIFNFISIILSIITLILISLYFNVELNNSNGYFVLLTNFSILLFFVWIFIWTFSIILSKNPDIYVIFYSLIFWLLVIMMGITSILSVCSIGFININHTILVYISYIPTSLCAIFILLTIIYNIIIYSKECIRLVNQN